MTVRAKFKCHSKEVREQNGSNVASLTFFASYGEGQDNKDWSKWTPSGTLQMTITNPNAFGWFEPGKEYYLDFTEAQ
ncbi:hypothetical protein [Caudoviricetes sp.]|nr:hypothetical protein [Caudoviricetes sp.]